MWMGVRARLAWLTLSSLVGLRFSVVVVGWHVFCRYLVLRKTSLEVAIESSRSPGLHWSILHIDLKDFGLFMHACCV